MNGEEGLSVAKSSWARSGAKGAGLNIPGVPRGIKTGEKRVAVTNVIDGKLVCEGVAESFGMSCVVNPFEAN